mmetsp:Transcript_2618/g.10134  ORF Transcript_2618/g.10134 Transcript_2618/m.10134 type:complete len:101 (-) Transcript_2618:761-1063(-)
MPNERHFLDPMVTLLVVIMMVLMMGMVMSMVMMGMDEELLEVITEGLLVFLVSPLAAVGPVQLLRQPRHVDGKICGRYVRFVLRPQRLRYSPETKHRQEN